MAIQYNENIKIAAPNPLDKRYLSNRTSGGSQLPYSATTEVNTSIISSERYRGLTVNINGVEYWYKDGVGFGDLIEKKYNTLIPYDNIITGATNLGYFSGFTGVQILPINNVDDNYDGNYCSLYNNYYRGTDGNICIGAPSDGILRRGYVKTSAPVSSWIWNDYVCNSDKLGWILVDGNIEEQLGTFQDGVTYYNGTSTFPYTATTWTTGGACNNGSSLTIGTVLGSLSTGNTLTIGGRPFAQKNENLLEFKTIKSETPTLLSVRDDGIFIYLSGDTNSLNTLVANGLTKTNNIIKLGGTLTGDTKIYDTRATTTGIEYGGNYSTGFTDNSLVTKSYVDNKSFSISGNGERVSKIIQIPSHSFSVGNAVGWSGGTYNKPIANGLYDGEILGIVSKCYNSTCVEITQSGFVTGLTGGLCINCTYFLSDVTAGQLTTTRPTTPNHIIKSMLVATSNTTGWVLPYPAYTISTGVTGHAVCNPTTNAYSVKPNDYYIGVSGGSIVTLQPNIYGAATNGTVIVVSDICGNASACCFIAVSGLFFGGATVSCINTSYGSMTFIYNSPKSRWDIIGFSSTPY